MIAAILFFLSLYILGGIFDFRKDRIKDSHYCLLFFCLILAFLSGFRSEKWPDTPQYIYAFVHEIKPIFDFATFSDVTVYAEPGFALLSSLIKTIYPSVIFYFIIIAILTMGLLYKSLVKFCALPLLGLSVYLSRFFISRNMMQIRAALAIAILLFAIQYIKSREFRKFMFIVIGSAMIHYSTVVAIPLYWLYKIKLSQKKCFFILGVCIAVIGIASEIIKEQIVQLNYLIGMNNTYIGGDESYSEGLGIANPMIYYQCLVLYLWYRIPPNYQRNIEFYHVFKICYFYSTMTLIVLSPFLVLAGRLSTVFATLEILMIPCLLLVYSKKTMSFIPYFVT